MPKRFLFDSTLATVFALASVFVSLANDPSLDPIPREEAGRRVAATFDFTNPATPLDGWKNGPNVELSRTEKSLRALSTGSDPYFFSPALDSLDEKGDFLVELTARRTTTGFAQIFVSEEGLPEGALEFDEIRSARFAMDENGATRTYAVPIASTGKLKRLRFDLGLDAGEIEVETIALVKIDYRPVKFGAFSIADGKLEFSVANIGDESREIEARGGGETEKIALSPGATTSLVRYFPKEKPFETIDVVATWGDGESTARRYRAIWRDLLTDATVDSWEALESDELVVKFAPDASGALVVRRSDGAKLAALSPLFEPNSRAVDLFGSPGDVESIDPPPLVREGNEIVVSGARFSLTDDVFSVSVDSPIPTFAPTVRVFGDMEQAVLPGVEYLERGERSSSSLDVNPLERARFAPPTMSVTAPFVALSTEFASVALVWDAPEERVCFAVPDFLDGDETTSRFGVCGRKFQAKLRFATRAPIEESILWAVREIGLPEVPARPRTAAEEDALHLRALLGDALQIPNKGWAGAVGAGLGHDYACYGSDFVSAIWELTGELPRTPRIDIGGARADNFASVLLANKGELVARALETRASKALADMREDGSFRYVGPYLRGSDVDYASGDCAIRLAPLMDKYRYAGDRASLDAALKGLDFISKLRTPRGAQTWELSLHTPDLFAAAECARLNALAYRATGDAKYLAEARRWALAGLPFVYLWRSSALPDGAIMPYATIPVYGTTNWIAPCWIGTPVQWCGISYASALLELAPLDDSLDWRAIAEGIAVCAQKQECPDGAFAGLLPDSFDLASQTRNPLFINPCQLRDLLWKLDGRFTGVSVVDVAGKRVVAPFPARAEGSKIRVFARRGISYQTLIDGKPSEPIVSNGEDLVEIASR